MNKRERERENRRGNIFEKNSIDSLGFFLRFLLSTLEKFQKPAGIRELREIFILSTTVFYARKYYMNEICNFLVLPRSTENYYSFFVGIMFESCVACVT